MPQQVVGLEAVGVAAVAVAAVVAVVGVVRVHRRSTTLLVPRVVGVLPLVRQTARLHRGLCSCRCQCRCSCRLLAAACGRQGLASCNAHAAAMSPQAGGGVAVRSVAKYVAVCVSRRVLELYRASHAPRAHSRAVACVRIKQS